MRGTDGDDDEHHLDAFEQNRLERGQPGQIIGAPVAGLLLAEQVPSRAKAATSSCSAMRPESPKDGLAQPSHGQRGTSSVPMTNCISRSGIRPATDRTPAQGWRERERQTRADEGRPPALRHADGEDDGEGFDDLDEGAEKGGRDRRSDRCQSCHGFVRYTGKDQSVVDAGSTVQQLREREKACAAKDCA